MNKLAIINKTINTNNELINDFSNEISRGDNKNILYTLPYDAMIKQQWKFLYIEDIINDYKISIIETIKNKINIEPNIILFFRANTLISKYRFEIKNIKSYKILYIDDLHDSNEITELKYMKPYVINKFDLILSTYKYCINKFLNKININKVLWFPHSFNELFKIKYNENPQNKILLSGAINENYPMRLKMLELKQIYPIEVLEHPRYGKSKIHKIIGNKYIKCINKYKYAFACCLNNKTPYLVQKFFEIPGAGALLLAYDEYIKEPFQQLGFIDMDNYISVNKENLEEKIKFVLDENNSDIVEKIRKNGYDFINKNHTHAHRIELLEQYLKSI
jgi:hypothetical protein